MFGEKWLLYYIFLCLAVLNKETAILLPAVFAVYYLGRMEKKRYLTHVILQFAVGIGLIGILILIFRIFLAQKTAFLMFDASLK